MRALIIEDEPAAARRLKTMLHTLDKDITIMDVLDSVEDAVAFLTSQPEPDLIFADIQLSDGVCFDIFKQIMPNSAVIFTTAYDEYAMERSEERRVGKECRRLCRSRWSPYH
jgi:two-component SAPR family response regulator